MVDVVTRQTTAGVGQDLIGNLLAGGEFLAAVSRALAGSKDQLSSLDDIAQLVTDMGLLGDVVDLGHQSGLGSNDLGNGSLTAGVGMTMIMGEHQSQVAGIAADAFLLAAIHEHAGIGNEHVVEDGQGLYVADLCEGSFQTGSLMMLTGQSHQLDAVPVSGQGKGHGIVAILCIHELGGQGDNLVHIGGAGVTDLRAADDDALSRSAVDVNAVHVRIHDVEELVGIGLHMGSLIFRVPGTLYVSLCAVADQIPLLAVLDVLLETVMILGAAGLVAVIGDGEQGVEGIGAHAALHAAAHAMADQPGHELLLQKIFHRLVNVGRTVMHGAVGVFDHTDVCVIGVVGGVVALLHDIGAADNPVGQVTALALDAVGTVNFLAVQIDIGLHRKKTSLVLFISSNCH